MAFGCAFANEGDGKAAMASDIATWYTEADVDLLGLYEWAFPTEVNLDKLNETHRTSSGNSEELNKIMHSGKHQKGLVEQAQRLVTAGGSGAGIPTIYANARELPDVDDVLQEPAVCIRSVEQIQRAAPEELPEL